MAHRLLSGAGATALVFGGLVAQLPAASAVGTGYAGCEASVLRVGSTTRYGGVGEDGAGQACVGGYLSGPVPKSPVYVMTDYWANTHTWKPSEPAYASAGVGSGGVWLSLSGVTWASVSSAVYVRCDAPGAVPRFVGGMQVGSVSAFIATGFGSGQAVGLPSAGHQVVPLGDGSVLEVNKRVDETVVDPSGVVGHRVRMQPIVVTQPDGTTTVVAESVVTAYGDTCA